MNIFEDKSKKVKLGLFKLKEIIEKENVLIFSDSQKHELKCNFVINKLRNLKIGNEYFCFYKKAEYKRDFPILLNVCSTSISESECKSLYTKFSEILGELGK